MIRARLRMFFRSPGLAVKHRKYQSRLSLAIIKATSVNAAVLQAWRRLLTAWPRMKMSLELKIEKEPQ
jgi:hypothetical protein